MVSKSIPKDWVCGIIPNDCVCGRVDPTITNGPVLLCSEPAAA